MYLRVLHKGYPWFERRKNMELLLIELPYASVDYENKIV